MKDQPSDWHWLDQGTVLSVQELSRSCRLRPEEIEELVAYGAITRAEPVAGTGGGTGMFSGEWVGPLRTAAQLRKDFDLDLFTVAMLLDYLRRIDTLERELRHLRAQLPSHAPAHHGPGRWREEHGNAHGSGR